MSNLCSQPAPVPLLLTMENMQSSICRTYSPFPFLFHCHPEGTISAYIEVLRKVVFSYICIYYMNSHGTREIPISICRPDVNSRSDKLSKL